MNPLSSADPAEVRWLWPGRIPLGMLSLIVGEPGIGKGLFVSWLASAVSTGRGWPDAPSCEPADVALATIDDLARTVRPRLDAVEADTHRIRALGDVLMPDGSRELLSFPRHLAQVEESIETIARPRLLVFDPITMFLGRPMSEGIRQLSLLARRKQIAVVLTSDGGKSAAAKALQSAAAMQWLIYHPGGKIREQRSFVACKCNVAEFPGNLEFRIAGPAIHWQSQRKS